MAAAPSATTKATPTSLPDIVLLLQPWSTAASQTKNRITEIIPRTLSSMMSLSDRKLLV